MKTLWLTSLGPSQDAVKDFISRMKAYGMNIKGHFWKDDLKSMAWMNAQSDLTAPDTACWVILDTSGEFSAPDIKYGLSLLAIQVQAAKGAAFPIIILGGAEKPVDPGQLPTPLKGADIISASDPGVGAKLVAKIHTPQPPQIPEYRIAIHGNEQIGQWFEIRPSQGAWSGVIFGVGGAEIIFQAVGPAGGLPDRSTLNYPMQGLKLQLGETEYTAWAIKNEIDNQTAYFAKVNGFPESILFGPYADEAAADVFVMQLK